MSATIMKAEVVLDVLKNRHTYYALNKDLPISNDRVQSIVQEAMKLVPSSFNMQQSRAVVLLGAEHERLWDIVIETLKDRLPAERWAPTEQKLNGFKAGAGSVLFFVDQDTVDTYSGKFTTYADKFPQWASQSDGMLQLAVWSALEAEGLGANLQHYNPLIDARVAEQWKLPSSWTLTSQLVFGNPTAPFQPKEKLPIEQTVRVFGA